MAPPSPPPYQNDNSPPSYWQPPPQNSHGSSGNRNQPTLINPQRRHDVRFHHHHHAGSAPGHPRVQFLVSIVRPWAIVVPFVTVVMNIWWFASGRLCGGIDDLSSECYWILWLSFPIVRVISLFFFSFRVFFSFIIGTVNGLISAFEPPFLSQVTMQGKTSC